MQLNILKEKLSSLEQVNEDLQKNIEMHEESQKELMELQNSLAELQSSLNLKESQVVSLNQMLEEKNEEIKNLQQNQKAELDSADQEVQVEFEKVCENAFILLNMKLIKFLFYKLQMNDLQEQFDSLQQANNQLKVDIENFQQIQQEFVELQTSHAEMQATLNMKEWQVTSLDQLLEEKNAEITTLEQTRDENQIELEKVYN